MVLRDRLHNLVFLWGLMACGLVHATEFDPRPGLLAQQDEWLGGNINASNLTQFDAYLPPALSELIAKGATELTTGPFITVPVHPSYVAATDQFGGQAELGAEVGDLLAKRPFPGCQMPLTHFGEKIAWNMRYGYGPDEAETEWMTWRYDMRTNNEERRIEMYGAIMRFVIVTCVSRFLPLNKIGRSCTLPFTSSRFSLRYQKHSVIDPHETGRRARASVDLSQYPAPCEAAVRARRPTF